MQREVSHLREELAALETGSVPKATAERLSLELANARMALDTYAKQVRRLEEKRMHLSPFSFLCATPRTFSDACANCGTGSENASKLSKPRRLKPLG
jgi:hypothetical protein